MQPLREILVARVFLSVNDLSATGSREHRIATLHATVRHTGTFHPGLVATSDWLVVTVRAWRDGDRQLIRLIARSEFNEISRASLESSNGAAAGRLEAWLDEFGDLSSPGPGEDDAAHEDAIPD